MDLNVLLRAHQIEVMKASMCRDDARRQGHFDSAARFAEEIGELRAAPNSVIPMLNKVYAGTLSYGSYAWDPLPESNSLMESWNNEDGTINSPKKLLAAGGLFNNFVSPVPGLVGARP